MRRRWLVLAVILTAPSGCDNVSWGGQNVDLVPPPAKDAMAPPTRTLEADAPPPPPLPEGPLLLAGTRNGNTATLRAVGEVVGDAVRPLPSDRDLPGFAGHLRRERLAPGTQFVLFSEGVRVGRLTVAESGESGGYCGVNPSVTGVVEMVPTGVGARRLLALPATVAGDRRYEAYVTHDHTYELRVGSLALASSLIPQVGATWPPSMLEARADIQAFQMSRASAPSVAATFLFNDRLAVSPPGEGAYALFVMGVQGAAGLQPAFSWYRPVDGEGKGAPRYFGHLDLNGDGSSEVILEVFGRDARWFATLARRGGNWVRAYQDPCGARGVAPG